MARDQKEARKVRLGNLLAISPSQKSTLYWLFPSTKGPSSPQVGPLNMIICLQGPLTGPSCPFGIPVVLALTDISL